MNTIDYLLAVKIQLGITSDYALAKALKVGQPSIIGYRSGRSVLSDDVALSIAEILDLPPIQIIATANIERAKTPEQRARWSGLLDRLTDGFTFLMTPAQPKLL